MITLEPSGIKAARGSQLMINITSTSRSTPRTRGHGDGWTNAHDKPTATIPRLLHEVKGQGTRKLDEAIVTGLGHDQHILNIRSDTRPAWVRLLNASGRAIEFVATHRVACSSPAHQQQYLQAASSGLRCLRRLHNRSRRHRKHSPPCHPRTE